MTKREKKTIIIIGDGMADEPIPQLNNRTPLQVAHTPYLDLLAKEGRNGLLQTTPKGYSPGSDVANLSILGYTVSEVFEGRASLEAESLGIDIFDDDLLLRCNLVTINNQKITDHTAGHISDDEATILINHLNEKLADKKITFHVGKMYKHILKIRLGRKEIQTTPPHDILDKEMKEYLIKSCIPESLETADILNKIIVQAQKLLENHPINIAKKRDGKKIANGIWLWSPGYKPKMKSFRELYAIEKGIVISAVDLIIGIGKYAGLESIEVEGATGLWNTNYEGKADAAIRALSESDFVYLHIEASDEAGHNGDYQLKVRTIEDFDARIVGPVYEAVKKWTNAIRIVVLPDHPTSCILRTHTNSPVPFILHERGSMRDNVMFYDEFEAKNGEFGIIRGNELMKLLFPKD